MIFKWIFSHMKPLIVPEMHKAMAEELAIAKKGLLADMRALFVEFHPSQKQQIKPASSMLKELDKDLDEELGERYKST
jgi:hypothetical protein